MYTPQPNDEGVALLLVALRDYLAADPSIVALLPKGAQSIIPEGFFTDQMTTPVIMPTLLGDTMHTNGVATIRFLVYVLDRGRGYYDIERILYRLYARINQTANALDFFTFPVGTPLRVLHMKAGSSSASLSFPVWQAEGRGLYVFMNVEGIPVFD